MPIPSTRYLLLAFTVSLPVLLAGCGDGWVVQRYSGTPYDGGNLDSDERTAGYGVQYVRASLMPSRPANTETLAPVLLQSAEPVFNARQNK